MLSKNDLHFLQMASLQGQQQVSQSGNPVHKSRGAILVGDNKIIAQASNEHMGGNLYKPESDEKYVATINAELSACGKAIEAGVAPFSNLTIYVSDSPNWYTFKMLVTLGIKRIVHYGPIGNDRITHYAQELGIQIISVG